jgi:hypothetical protein
VQQRNPKYTKEKKHQRLRVFMLEDWFLGGRGVVESLCACCPHGIFGVGKWWWSLVCTRRRVSILVSGGPCFRMRFVHFSFLFLSHSLLHNDNLVERFTFTLSSYYRHRFYNVTPALKPFRVHSHHLHPYHTYADVRVLSPQWIFAAALNSGVKSKIYCGECRIFAPYYNFGLALVVEVMRYLRP